MAIGASLTRGIVKFSGSVADLADEPRHAERPWLSISPRDHQPRRLAVSPRRGVVEQIETGTERSHA